MKTLKFKALLVAFTLLQSIELYSQADPGNGNECPECPSTASSPCLLNPTFWALGGNNIIVPPGGFGTNLPGPATDVGTCNEFPFILKANNNKSVYILPNSKIGIGFQNSSPAAVLDIRDGNAQVPSNFRIYGDANGNLESTTDITMNYSTGKSFAVNEGPINSGVSRLFMQNGKVGFNTSNPASNLDIIENGAAGIRLHSTTNNSSYLWTLNSVMSYNFGTDANGIGQIGTNISTPASLLNFRLNTANNKPQVWIGKRPTTGSHTDFSLAVDGKIVANSVYVTLQGNWADFVFEDNYKLMPVHELEKYYKSNHHLPGIPSADAVKANGVDLENMNTLLLMKIEELTLYVVSLQKQLDEIKKSTH